MAIRQEQIVFGCAALLLGYMAYSGSSGDGGVNRSRPKKAPVFESNPAPNTSIALPGDRFDADGMRDLFTPPRDTVALPPLDLERPPFEPLPVLAPPALWGPAAGHLEVLRREPSSVDVPALFDGEALSSIADRSNIDEISDENLNAGMDIDLLSPQERKAIIEGYQRLYDWAEVDGNIVYGSVRNSDRYSLAERLEEPLLFILVEPETGEERFPGQAPIEYERDRVHKIHFAKTAVNEIELARLTFREKLGPSDLERAITFAQRCIEVRHEAPKALDMAEDVLKRAAEIYAVNAKQLDVAPQLVLARVYEVGFRFEDAFDLYTSLLEDQGQDINPEVWSRLGALQARFRMFGRAEQSHAQALGLAPGSWLVRWTLGRFLLERGRFEEAITHLTAAEAREPSLPESQPFRVGIRRDLGWALLSIGRLEDAHRAFQRAVNADPTDENAVSGLLSTARMLGEDDLLLGAREAVDTLQSEGAGASFELLLALGLDAIEEGDWLAARRNLAEATTADPFRAHLALRARSALADRTGNTDVALNAIEAAYQVDPTDPWVLLQRGRLLFQRDDLEGAETNLRAALNHELDFVEALVGMAVLMEARGDAAAAERYWERASTLEDDMANIHARRGWNLLDMNDVEAASNSFRAGLRVNPGMPAAQGGLAWCYYLRDNAEESITLLGELAERQTDPTSPIRIWAESQIVRIQDHQEKEVWLERFDRAPGIVLGNGWQIQEGFGPEVNLEEQAAHIRGRFTESGRVRMWREEPVDAFLRFEGDVTISGDTKARVGIFVSREQQQRLGDSRVTAAVSLSRNRDGNVQRRFQRQAGLEAEYENLFTSVWPTGQPMRVAIARRGSGSDTVIDLYVDDLPVLQGVPMPRLGASTQTLRFGLFVEGDTGRSCAVTIDDVRVVRRRP
jgi:tetratricopeptide (TPR) repeat protein